MLQCKHQQYYLEVRFAPIFVPRTTNSANILHTCQYNLCNFKHKTGHIFLYSLFTS